MTTAPTLRRIARAAGLVAVLASASSLTACNTIAGAGEDVSSAGHGIANGATATKNAVTGN